MSTQETAEQQHSKPMIKSHVNSLTSIHPFIKDQFSNTYQAIESILVNRQSRFC